MAKVAVFPDPGAPTNSTKRLLRAKSSNDPKLTSSDNPRPISSTSSSVVALDAVSETRPMIDDEKPAWRMIAIARA